MEASCAECSVTEDVVVRRDVVHRLHGEVHVIVVSQLGLVPPLLRLKVVLVLRSAVVIVHSLVKVQFRYFVFNYILPFLNSVFMN